MSPNDALLDLRERMVAVGLDSQTIQASIDNLGLSQTVVACYNSPTAQTISGPIVEVERLHQELLKSNVHLPWHELDTDDVAYHALYMKLFYDYLFKGINDVFGGQTREFDSRRRFSTSRRSGDDTEATVGAHYHTMNITNPVGA